MIAVSLAAALHQEVMTRRDMPFLGAKLLTEDANGKRRKCGLDSAAVLPLLDFRL